MISVENPDHRHQQGPLAVVWATDSNMAPTGSTAQGHQHDFRQQHRPWTSTTSPVRAQTQPLDVEGNVNTNMASGGTAGHKQSYVLWVVNGSEHQHGLKQQHSPQSPHSTDHRHPYGPHVSTWTVEAAQSVHSHPHDHMTPT